MSTIRACILALLLPATLPAQAIVSSASPEASAAGIEVLAQGGNAIDAAVAVAFSLGVTEPAMSGLFGGLHLVAQAPGEAPFVINGTTWAPRATPPGTTAAEVTGHRATTVPTTVLLLETAWREKGSGRLPWAALLAPAIRHAEEGFVLAPFRHRTLEQAAERLRRHPSGTALALLPDGSLPAVNSTWRQPALARTLRRIAAEGAEAFYRGDIARQIAADMAAHGGWLSAEDLALIPPTPVQPALRGSYRGWEVATLNPPASGWVVLQILNVLEASDLDMLLPGSPQRGARIAEALHIGHTSNRNRPIPALDDPDSKLQQRIHKDAVPGLRAASQHGETGRGETTHFSLVDASGMVVAVTASINSPYGAKVGSAELGLFYNDYMIDFTFGDPSHPFAVRGGSPPFSSMSATILARQGVPQFAVGSPGSARIISATAQVAQLWADGQASVAAAVAHPRWHVVPPNRLYSEGPPAEGEAVAAERGWQFHGIPGGIMTEGLSAYFGGVHAVAFEGGRWVGSADPRRDGAVATLP